MSKENNFFVDTMGNPVFTPEQNLRCECLRLACLSTSGSPGWTNPSELITKARHFEQYVTEG